MEHSELLSRYRRQRDYALSGRAREEGSQAIAAGRATGLALELGREHEAQQLWRLSYFPSNCPGLNDFHRGYQAHPEQFSAFADPQHFPGGGTALSNALGSYAYALDYVQRGDAALAGGEAQWCCHWGAEALRAAGLETQATALAQHWQQPAASRGQDARSL